MGESTHVPRTATDAAGVPGLPSSITRLTPLQWLICGVAALGFAFDLYEALVMPLIVRPALAALGNFKLGSPGYNFWVGLLFYLPLASGGVFGLVGGYLTDLLGPAGSGLEHPAVCLFRLRRQPVSYVATAINFPLHNHHRRVC